MKPFSDLAKELLATDVKELEYAATIAYFRRHGSDWPDAVREACAFKKLTEGSSAVRQAEKLARKVLKN